jgi:hypothetical protein
MATADEIVEDKNTYNRTGQEARQPAANGLATKLERGAELVETEKKVVTLLGTKQM